MKQKHIYLLIFICGISTALAPPPLPKSEIELTIYNGGFKDSEVQYCTNLITSDWEKISKGRFKTRGEHIITFNESLTMQNSKSVFFRILATKFDNPPYEDTVITDIKFIEN